jgi:putative endonuclease
MILQMTEIPAQCKSWNVYVVECADGSLYTGITTDLNRRLEEHNSGKGAKYTKTRRPVCLRASWHFPDRSSASKEEARIKKLSRKDKLLLITL